MKIITDLINVAKDLNIPPTEMRVYAALLELGHAQVATIAKRAGLQRTTVYSALDRLKEIGLASQGKTAGAAHFIPAAPESLVLMAEEKLALAKKNVTLAKEISAMLRSKEGIKAASLPKVQIFEGAQSIKKLLYEQDGIWRESQMEHDGRWVGFQDDTFLIHYGGWVLDYWHTYKNAKDRDREQLLLFGNASTIDANIKSTLKDTVGIRRQLKPLPLQVDLSTTVWCLGDYVITLKTRKAPHLAVVFRDSDLADNLSIIFQLLWKLC